MSRMLGSLTICIVALVLTLSPMSGEEQHELGVSIHVDIGADSVSVGDRIPVRFEISHPDTMEFAAIEGRRNLGDIYLLGQGERSGSASVEGVVHDTLYAYAVPFKTGAVVLPPVVLFYETSGGGRGEVKSDSAAVYVRSVLPEDATDIKPLKPNIPAPSDIGAYILIALIICLLAAGSALVLRYWKKKPGPVKPAPPSKPAHEVAFEELEKIAQMRLLSRGMFKQYYSLISETIRRYIGDRYRFETMDLTTAELVGEMRKQPDEVPVKDFESFLRRSDLVKFAKLVPPYDEMESAIQSAQKLVSDTMRSEPEESPVQAAGVRGESQ